MIDPLEARKFLLRRIEWIGFPPKEQEQEFLDSLYASIQITAVPVPPEYNMVSFIQDIKSNRPPNWILTDPEMSEKFATAYQKYLETQKEAMMAYGQASSSSYGQLGSGMAAEMQEQPDNEANIPNEAAKDDTTYEVIQFPGKKGIHDVLSFRLEEAPHLCYVFSHRRTNKTNRVYNCIACKNNKEDRRETQVVVVDGRFQSHPGKLGHSCQPLSWEQECYKRKCYETVRKLRYNGPNGVSPMEAYEKMMEEMKTKGVTPDKLFDNATYRNKRASFSRAINAHKRRKADRQAEEVAGNDDSFLLDYSEAQETSPQDDTGPDVSVIEEQEDVKDFAKLDLPLPPAASSQERLLDEMKIIENNYYELLTEREKDQKEMETLRNEAETLRKENQHLKELCEERKRHIDTLQTLISKIH